MNIWRLVTASFFLLAALLGAASADTITVNSLTAPQDPQVGSLLDFFGTVSTTGTDTISTISIDWGDGSTSAAGVVTPGTSSTFEGNHLYTFAGTYNIVVTATDSGGDKGTLTAPFQIPSGVPEPGSMWLLGTGLLSGIGAMRRRFPK